MIKKKLQLKELKVKSHVTLVDKVEQRTAKGGYISNNKEKSPYVVIDISDVSTNWTEYKTRIVGDSGSSLLGGLSGGKGSGNSVR